MSNVLVCTVGGSHEPILTAIKEVQPEFVCFVCTDKDPATLKPGSLQQVVGKGHPIVVHRGDEETHLPNLVTLAGLEEGRFETCVVPADNLDLCYQRVSAAVADLAERFPNSVMIADYTGGTKTMTAALVLASLDNLKVELRLVTGMRADLVRVSDGTQRSVAAAAQMVRLKRALDVSLRAWQTYGYGEAALALGGLPAPADDELRAELQVATDLSRAFDAWDRFDHGRALELLDSYRPRIGAGFGPQMKFLETLAGSSPDRRREPAQLWDLWLNAQRRAVQGRFDDAVGRTYRLLEWTAQWLLRDQKGWDTANLPEGEIPAGVAVTVGREGRVQAGLFAAWDLVARVLQGAAAEFAESERSRMLDHLRVRNASILAHGYTPVTEESWAVFSEWVQDKLLPVLEASAKQAGLRSLPGQLPNFPFWRS